MQIIFIDINNELIIIDDNYNELYMFSENYLWITYSLQAVYNTCHVHDETLTNNRAKNSREQNSSRIANDSNQNELSKGNNNQIILWLLNINYDLSFPTPPLGGVCVLTGLSSRIVS